MQVAPQRDAFSSKRVTHTRCNVCLRCALNNCVGRAPPSRRRWFPLVGGDRAACLCWKRGITVDRAGGLKDFDRAVTLASSPNPLLPEIFSGDQQESFLSLALHLAASRPPRGHQYWLRFYPSSGSGSLCFFSVFLASKRSSYECV